MKTDKDIEDKKKDEDEIEIFIRITNVEDYNVVMHKILFRYYKNEIWGAIGLFLVSVACLLVSCQIIIASVSAGISLSTKIIRCSIFAIIGISAIGFIRYVATNLLFYWFKIHEYDLE